MWDTGHGYLDKGAPLLVRKLSERPLLAMAFSPNCRLISVTDGFVEYRLSADKVSGPVRTLPMTGPGQAPRKVAAYVADPFNRYMLSAHQEGLTFHPVFETDWKAELGSLESGASALAISPDGRLLAVALNDGRLLVGLAPDQARTSFLPLRRIESGQIHHLGFAGDNTHLLAVGRHGVGIYNLDWNLEPIRNRPWDKRADIVLRNFLARHPGRFFTQTLLQALAAEMSGCGLIGHDPKVLQNRLQEALEREAGA
jgi:hypothetical protein